MSQSMRLTDKRTDGRTDKRTVFSWLDRVACNACSAVKAYKTRSSSVTEVPVVIKIVFLDKVKR